uniref:Uncharacterized protein n=1 Tax=Ditylenchus dipsaci TaxID=166011 RepID=A0A915CV61_9BILA
MFLHPSTLLTITLVVVSLMAMVAYQEVKAQRYGWYNGYYPYPRTSAGFYRPGYYGPPYYYNNRYYNRFG